LKRTFDEVAAKNKVLPINPSFDRAHSNPPPPGGRSFYTFYPGATQLFDATAPGTRNRTHTITAYVDVPSAPANGVLVADGGSSSGYVLYLKDGTKLEGDVKRSIKGWVVTDAKGKVTIIENDKVQSIELKASNRISGRYGDKGHVIVNAYNRKVLLSGEVPTDAAKADAELQASTIENVRAVVNELQVGLPTSLTTRSNDTLITGKVKTSLIDAKDLFAIFLHQRRCKRAEPFPQLDLVIEYLPHVRAARVGEKATGSEGPGPKFHPSVEPADDHAVCDHFCEFR